MYSRHIFPRILEWALRRPEVCERRWRALQWARGRVIEIGFGTGLNLRHYPDPVTELIAVDVEIMLPGRVSQRVSRVAFPVKFIRLDASKLPFEDDSFDTAVSTWTLCSISDVAAALSEIRRVLKPGGQLIFLEHGRSDDPRVARRQDLLNPIQRAIAAGCNLNRKIDQLIAQAGFRLIRLDRSIMPGVPRILAEIYCGLARPGKASGDIQ